MAFLRVTWFPENQIGVMENQNTISETWDQWRDSVFGFEIYISYGLMMY